jgi:hypothetical protein
MTKLSLLGVAAIAACTAFAVPASAQHRASLNAYDQAGTCAGYDPGNPYNKETDYLDWSAWRARGGWDPRNDFKCAPAPTHMSHGEF